MILNDTGLNTLNQRYTIAFISALKAAPVDYKRLSVETDSVTKTEHYPISGPAPKMREWLGERQRKNLNNYDMQITNRKFESTVEVKVEDVEDDRYAIYDSKLTGLGEQAGLLPSDLLVDLIVKGGTSACYDKQYFFDSDHPVNPSNPSIGVQSNLLTSLPLNADNYATARAKFQTTVNENGDVINANPNLLVVPAALEKTAKSIVAGDYVSVAGGSTQSNVMRGTADVLVIPQLDIYSTTTWYLFDVSSAVKPFIIQRRVAPQLQTPAMNAGEQFERDVLIYGARARYGAGYNLWQLAQKCTA